MSVLILFLLHFFRPEPRIVIARDTTYITEPLRSNGLPDYERYALGICRDGATPDNNAAALVWQAIWPGALEPRDYELMRAELGLNKIPSADGVLQPLAGEANKKRVNDWRLKQHSIPASVDTVDLIFSACDHPWTSKQFPPLAEWMNANKRPLDMLIQASHRPRFYSPSPTLLYKEYVSLDLMLLPGTQAVREAARDLSARAMWHIGEQRLNESWTDLIAVHRLARLAAQSHTIIEQCVAMSTSHDACEATVALLGSDRMSVELANQIQKDLAELPTDWNVSDCFNNVERLETLDTLFYVKRHGLYDPERYHGPEVTEFLTFDWNVALRRANYWYDRLVAATQLPTRETRKKAFAQLKADITADGQRVKQPAQLAIGLFSLHKRSEMMGGLIACLCMSNADSAIEAIEFEDHTKTDLQLTCIAAAIAAFRAQHQSYPAKLDDLPPAVFEKVPLDVFNSKQFVYKRTDDGYLLYSCGENGVDDGGSHEQWNIYAGRSVEGPDKSKSWLIPAGADDISIRLPRPPFTLPKTPSSTSQP